MARSSSAMASAGWPDALRVSASRTSASRIRRIGGDDPLERGCRLRVLLVLVVILAKAESQGLGLGPGPAGRQHRFDRSSHLSVVLRGDGRFQLQLRNEIFLSRRLGHRLGGRKLGRDRRHVIGIDRCLELPNWFDGGLGDTDLVFARRTLGRRIGLRRQGDGLLGLLARRRAAVLGIGRSGGERGRHNRQRKNMASGLHNLLPSAPDERLWNGRNGERRPHNERHGPSQADCASPSRSGSDNPRGMCISAGQSRACASARGVALTVLIG